MSISIFLTRHGQTEFNIQGIMQGWADSPLTEKGVSAAIELGKKLKNNKYDALITSDLGRAADTGNYIIRENIHTIPSFKEEGLREWGFGALEKSNLYATIIENATEKARETGDFTNNYLKFFTLSAMELDPSKNSETYEQITSRITNSFENIVKKAEENGWKDVLVVSHGLTITTTIYLFTGKLIKTVPNLEIIEIVYENGKFDVKLDERLLVQES